METKCCVSKLKGLGLNMGFKYCVGVYAVGLSGGIRASWDNRYHFSLVLAHPRFLILKVKDERRLDWLLVLLYGHPNVRARYEAWKDISNAFKGRQLLVLVMGDFNQVMFAKEKLSKIS